MSGRQGIAGRRLALGLWLAVLSVTAHVSVGAVLWPEGLATAQVRALDRLQTLCLGRHPAPARQTPRPAPVAPALCPPPASFAVPLWLPEAGPVMPPPPAALHFAESGRDGSRRRAARVSEAALPRGPPRSA